MGSDKGNDRSKFMETANQNGQQIVNIFIKIYAIAYPIALISECCASAVYSQIRYGYIEPRILFRPFRLS